MLFNKALSGRTFSGTGDPIPCDYDKAKTAASIAAFKTHGSTINTTLPPDPGAAGKATLEGVDSNHNGVRDDVEIAIWNYAPRDDQTRYRAALFQLAKYLQARVKQGSTGSVDDVFIVYQTQRRTSDCIKKDGVGSSGVDDLRFLQKLVYNTALRAKADNNFNAKADHTWKEVHDPIPCDYDKR
ncbi:hypothetical protein AGMMS50229_18260 [Campylobacterota bacterium]|nr:hypothetical protein AGMMS50229_18260 [Campylobacterota bacterium]